MMHFDRLYYRIPIWKKKPRGHYIKMASAVEGSIGNNFVDPKSVSPNAPGRFQKGTVIMPLAPKQAATIFYSRAFQIQVVFSLSCQYANTNA